MAGRARTQADTEAPIFGGCTLVLGDFRQGVQREPAARSLLRAANLLSAACLLGALALYSRGRSGSAVAMGVVGALLLGAHNVIDAVAVRWYQKTPEHARSLRFTLSSSQLIVASGGEVRAYEWRRVHAQVETANLFLVWISPKLFLIVPKRAFEAAELDAVRARLRRSAGSRPPATFSTYPYALLIAGGLLALWLWNTLAPRQ